MIKFLFKIIYDWVLREKNDFVILNRILIFPCMILNLQPPPQQDPAILSYQRSPSSNLLPSTNGNRETEFVEKLLVSQEYLLF